MATITPIIKTEAAGYGVTGFTDEELVGDYSSDLLPTITSQSSVGMGGGKKRKGSKKKQEEKKKGRKTKRKMKKNKKATSAKKHKKKSKIKRNTRRK